MEKEKLEKIKMIKKIKSEKRMMYIFIFLLILVIIFVCLYFADKNNNTFGGKLAKHSNIKEKSSYAKDKDDEDNIKENTNQSSKSTNTAKNSKENTSVASTANKDSEGKEADVAAKVAINKFKELGENVKKEDLEILKIQRDGEELYYISSKENTAEVRISDSKITRLNSVPVK